MPVSSANGALLVYLEPTPYILDLLRELRQFCQIPFDVWFLKENASQNWNLELPEYCRVVKHGLAAFIGDVRQLLRTREPSLVHLGGWGGDRRLSILILMTWAHGIPLFIESDTQEPFEESRWRRALKRLAYPTLFRIPAMFLPGGTRQSRYLKSYGVTDERIQIARMTVDVSTIISFSDRFDVAQRLAWRKRRGISPEATVFLFVGRLEPHKGIVPLIEAFERVFREDSCARLVVVGDGSSREIVETQAAKCDWLVALGRLDGDELLCAYCMADVFVLTSSFEPWGLVVNEAMAAGLPVVVSSRVGCVEDLVDGVDSGLVYTFDDADGLVSSLRSLLHGKELRAAMGRNARRVISAWTLRGEAERMMAAWIRVP